MVAAFLLLALLFLLKGTCPVLHCYYHKRNVIICPVYSVSVHVEERYSKNAYTEALNGFLLCVTIDYILLARDSKYREYVFELVGETHNIHLNFYIRPVQSQFDATVR